MEKTLLQVQENIRTLINYYLLYFYATFIRFKIIYNIFLYSPKYIIHKIIPLIHSRIADLKIKIKIQSLQ